jgi:hypothetical protein
MAICITFSLISRRYSKNFPEPTETVKPTKGSFNYPAPRKYFKFRCFGGTFDSDSFMLVIGKYGINRSEQIFKYIHEELYREAFENGIRTEIHQMAFYDQDRHVLYLFNRGNQIYRITTQKVELVDNGTDGVLFISDRETEPFTVLPGEQGASPLDELLFSKLNFESDILSPPERTILFIIFFYAPFFASIMPTKPILTMVGEKGSGKTTTLRLAGMVYIGEKFDVTSLSNDPKDFDAAVTNTPFVVFDNADQTKSWFDDKLAVASTGGSVQRRELYTTNKLIDFPIRAFIALTSRTPSFRRDDIADRRIIMRLGRIRDFKSERQILKDLSRKNEKIMSELLDHIQEILAALKDNSNLQEPLKFRMADFGEFALAIARYAGIEEEVRVIFSKLSLEQAYFTLEQDPIFELLLRWVPQNQGRKLSVSELCKELNSIAINEDIGFPYERNVQSFAQRLSNLKDNLEKVFRVSSRRGHARKTFYQFSLRD